MNTRSAARAIAGHRAFWDGVAVIAIVVTGVSIGSRYVATFQRVDHGEFGQAEFGAAVSFACGRGYVNPAPNADLSDFLSRRVERFSCERLSADRTLGPPNFTQALYRYLMIAVGLQWKWSGVSWSGLTPLFGIAFALTLSAAYGLFRLMGGPLIGALGVLPLAMSPVHLERLPHLRDYAKAPFMLLLILVMARMALAPLDRRRCLLLAAVFGAVLGIGLGFRNDLLIHVPPFAAVVLLLLPGPWRANVRLKAACLAVALVTFVASAWPVLAAYRSGSNTGHAAVLGLATTFDRSLGLTRPVYDFGSPYLDTLAVALTDTHSYLRTGHFVEYLSPEYDSAAIDLLRVVARHWPADILVRSYASVLRMLEFPFSVSRYAATVPHGISARWLLRLYVWHDAALGTLSGLGPPAVALTLAAIGASDPRAAVALIFLLLYYCGYPAIQFDVRHFFYLEVVSWWALAFVVLAGVRWLWAIATRRTTHARSFGQRARGVALAVGVMLLMAPPLWILRAYQQRHLTSVFGSYLQATRTPLELTRSSATGTTIVSPVNLDGLWPLRGAPETLAVRYLVVEFGAEQCAAADLPVAISYLATGQAYDFSERVRIPMTSSGATLRFMPVYSFGVSSRFVGFGIPSGYERCLKSVSAIDDVRGLPELVTLTLTPTWERSSLFQRLSDWEPEWTPRDRAAHAQPADLVVPVESHLLRVASPEADAVAPAVTRSPAHGWTGRVAGVGPHQWLMHFVSQPVEPGALLKASGILRRGGVAVGLIQNNQWVAVQTVTAPGPFTVLIRPPAQGSYGALVEDFSTFAWHDDRRSLLRRAVRFLVPPLLVDEFELHDVAWVKPTS